jgi:Zn-dependent peptidase ImmA (M78 family)
MNSASNISEAEVADSVLRLESLARDYLEIEQMTNSPLPRNYLDPYQIEYSRASPEDRGEEVADAERNRLGLGDGPIADLRSILEEAVGLRIFYIDLPSKIGGLFAYTEELGGCIAINQKHPPRRAKWSLAHEYGHFLTTRYQADVEMLDARWGKPTAEKFADAFAANFLMPRSGVCRRLSEMAKVRQGQVTIADVLSLAELYQVSTESMFRRLEDLKRLTPGTWQRLKTQGLRPELAKATLGISTDDPCEAMFPYRFRNLAVGAFNSGEISEENLAAKLKTDIIGARLEREKLTDYATMNGDGFAVLELNPSELL